jgi:flavin-dependent amine oxidoreductase
MSSSSAADLAALAVSLSLKQRGLRSVVLEKSDRIGGKALTQWRDGVMLELGTCYLARDYQQVAALAERFGVREWPLGSVSAHPQSLLDAFYNRNPLWYFTGAGASLIVLRRYAVRRRLALSRFAARIEDEYAAMAMPILDWLRLNRCERLTPIFNGLLDIYGYGPVMTMPALYALRWMTPDLIMTAFLKGSRQVVKGFGGLAQKMAAETEVLLSTRLGGSRREADGRWLLETSAGRFRARHVVVACAPTSPELHELFDQPRREILERDVLSTFYVSAAVAAKNWFTTHRRAFLKGPDHRDHLIAARCEGAAPDGSHYFICYLYPTIDDDAHMTAILRRDIAADGGELKEVVTFARWPEYMTRVTSEAIATGRYFRLEDRQGADNVWLCNSALAHENWRDLLALSRRVSDGIAAATKPVG